MSLRGNNERSRHCRGGMQSVAQNRIEALDEARHAVEEIVLPCGQPIELLPRTLEVLEAQVRPPTQQIISM